MIALKELRVFTGSGGELGRWTTGELAPVGSRDSLSFGAVLSGTLSGPLPEARSDDPLDLPFALLGSPRHVVVSPVTGGLGPGPLGRMMQEARRTLRIVKSMAEGLVATQYAVADYAPYLRDAVLVAGSTYPTGDLAKAPKPSSSVIAIHPADEGVSSGIRPIRLALQVMSVPNDARRFERYRLVAVIDFDGDGWREILIRARSVRGDRFRLFELTDTRSARALVPWVGASQALAPVMRRPAAP